MSTTKSDFLNVLQERGFIHQATDMDALDALLSAGPVTGYNGYDPTGPSLHVGHMLPTMMLYWLQQTGNKPIVLIGGATSKVGDPSGKDETRQLLTDEIIHNNITSIKGAFEKILTFGDGPSDAIMVNNADWLGTHKYIDFLRDVGRHFTINRMLTFDSVKTRLDREQPLTFLEFNYMILQAYDFAELAKRYGCSLQTGGSDQWGNIVNGIDLGRRLLDGRQLFGLTCPLLTTASGAKMGKTASGAVWLNEEMLSAYDYFQYWRNTEDADVEKFLALFTTLPMDEVRRLGALQGQEINEAKKILAYEATKLCRGKDSAEKAKATAEQTFAGGGISAGLPTFELPMIELEQGKSIIDLLRLTELVASNGEARRLIKGGGARINDESIKTEDWRASADHILDEGVIKVSSGKKRHALVKVT